MSSQTPTTGRHDLPVGPPPPFDPEFAPVLERLAGMPPLKLQMIPVARANRPAPPTLEQLSRDGAFTVVEHRAPGPAGAPDVTLLVCRPTAAETRTAAVYYVHGGAMVLGDARSELAWVLDAAAELGLTVVSVEYRLAPESPHPGPVEDCYAGIVWTVEHAEELGIDPDRIVLAGGSAGGCLAAAVALLARDRSSFEAAGLLLNSAMLDDRVDTVSCVQMIGTPFDRTTVDTGWAALLGDARGGPDVSPYAAPGRAVDLGRLPPAFIDVGSCETFRDENVDFAARIWHAGGQAELHVWPGGFHGFDLMAPGAQLSREAQAARRRWLERILAH